MSSSLFDKCPTCGGSGLVDSSLPVSDARHRARRTAPDTAHDAAVKITVDSARKIHVEILTLLDRMEGGLADWQIAYALRDRNASTLRARRSELMHADMVIDSGRRTLIPDTRRQTIVWTITDLGRLAAARTVAA
jgi:hypothetical protein